MNNSTALSVDTGMKTIWSWIQGPIRVLGLAAFLLGSVSCMNTYDAYGRPVQSVDPGVAIAGVAAAGIIGYSLADGHHHHRYPRHYSSPHRYHCR